MNDTTMVVGQESDAYHSSPAIGASGLKRFQVSPLHYWAEYLDPERERVDKKHFRIGRAWHCAVFEPQEFGVRYVAGHDAHPATTRAKVLAEILALDATAAAAEVQRLKGVPDDIKSTTKEGKALFAELEAQGLRPMAESDVDWIVAHAARMHCKDVLASDDITRVQKMAAISRALPISRVVFEQMAEYGMAEASLYCTDPTTGVQLKVRPDYMLKPCPAFPNGLIIDGKSTTDAGDGFARQVWNLDYGIQAALYPSVYQRVFGTDGLPPFLWLAQEKQSPFAARYYAAGSDLIEHYSRKIMRWLPAVAECQRTGVWPGYPTDVQTLAMPDWAEKQMADQA